jgi:hypothetical protein
MARLGLVIGGLAAYRAPVKKLLLLILLLSLGAFAAKKLREA